ncbi:hypothetical protein CXB51_000333 [Gossypium anomalum]|uniref:Aminotransferase-like plant mobile domain-containing protein n=1 Tax=Gossypium anomalum TaxID=47600 RepID=A0A8J6D8G1_9ROSI|nr:hypothetical protein CXB51_000333 [Gossypium anomalum]
MENDLLNRVEGNADIHRWLEQIHLEKGYRITMGYVSELSDYTRISVTQNNLQELKEIWDQWGNETKRLFYDNYGDLPYLLDIQVNEHLFRALAQFWNPAFHSDRIYSRAACVPTFWKKLMTIIGMSEQWITARIKKKGECKCISWDALKDLILTHPDEKKKATTDLFHRLSKRVTSVPAVLAETFRSLGVCRKAGAGRFIGCAQLLMAWFYSHFQLIDGIIYQGMLSRELHGWFPVRYFIDAVALIGFPYWEFGVPLVVAIGSVTTLEYVEWRKRRINDNVPMTKIEETRPMEEYLQAIPSELDIIKQELKRKNLELEKKIEKLKEEKMYLSLDVDQQKKEVEKVRKEKRKVEEDRDGLKEEYKKAQVSLKRVGLGKSSEQWQKKV